MATDFAMSFFFFFTFAGNLFLERVYLCKDVQSKEIGVEKEMRQCGTKGLSG